MKRPSGFDRAPDPRRPAPELPAFPAQEENAAADGAAAGETRGGLSLFKRRAVAANRGKRDVAEPTVEAETLDLSQDAAAADHDNVVELSAARDGGAAGGDAAVPSAAGPAAAVPTEAVSADAASVDAGAAAAAASASAVAAASVSAAAALDGAANDQAETVELGGALVAADDGASGGRQGVRGALARLRGGREADPVRAAEQRVREASKLVRTRRRRETRRFSAHARRRRRNWFIALGTVAALAAFVAIGAYTPIMAVRDVQIVGAQSVNEADVRKALERFDGVPLALIDSAEVHQALEPFPLIQRYAVELVPPQTLVVRIEERVAVVSIPQPEGGVTLHDAAGVLVGAADAPPVGVPLSAGSVSDTDSAAFRSAASALRDMPVALRDQVVGVNATSGQDVTFTLSSGIAVLWGDAAQTKRKSVILQTILGSLGERPVTQIDVSSTEAPVFR